MKKISTEIKLTMPIKINGIEQTALSIRLPTVGDLLDAEKCGGSDSENELKFISLLSATSPEDLKALSLKDYKEIRKAVGKMQA